MSPKNKGKFGKAKPSVEPQDEFVSGMQKLGIKLRPYAVRLIIGAAAVFVFLAGLFTYRWWTGRQASQATAIYADAVELSQRRIEPPKTEDPENAEDPDAADPDAPAALPEAPAFESESARAQAVLKRLEALRSEYGSTSAAREARLLHARTLLELGRPDDAIPLYEAYRKDAATADLRFLAQEGIGYAHEARAAAADAATRQAALEQALEAFRQIQPAEQGPFKDYALYHEARILVALDKRDEAKAALEKAAAIENSALDHDIKDRLALLEAAAAE